MFKVIVNFDFCSLFIKQYRSSPTEWLNIRFMGWKVLNDPSAEIIFSAMIFYWWPYDLHAL